MRHNETNRKIESTLIDAAIVSLSRSIISRRVFVITIRFPRIGIPVRFMLFTLLSVFICFIVLGGLLMAQISDENHRRMTYEAQDAIATAKEAVKQPLWNFDKATIVAISQALLGKEQGIVVGIRILSHKSELIYQRFINAEDEQRMNLGLMQTGAYKYIDSDVVFQNQVIGKVMLLLTSSDLDREAMSFAKKIIFMTFCALFFVSVVLFMLTHSYFIRPFHGLMELVGEIKEGNYNEVAERTQKLISVNKFPLEFGTIAAAFVKAVRAIEVRDRQLKDYADNLEIQVQRRTEEIDQQRMKLVESARMASIGEMSAGIAHEINNPLAVISGRSSYLIRHFEEIPGNESVIDGLKKINLMSQRISKIIKSLRTFARDGSRNERAPILTSEFFSDLQDLCMARMLSLGIDLQFSPLPTNVALTANEVQLSQVLINLINNAADAIQNLESRWIRVSVRMLEQNTELGLNAQLVTEIRVVDSGAGIPTDLQKQIMQPFFTTKELGKGTGLGLSISLNMINQNGGKLFYDETEKNTCFVILLPVQ